MQLEKTPVTATQFAIFRIILGTYLFLHFIMLIPYGSELFSNVGTVPDINLLPTHSFPNILYIFSSTQSITIFLSFLTLLSLLFTLGTLRPVMSLFLWYGWACLFNRNIFISNPSLPMVGWLLLACVFIPVGEGHSLTSKQHTKWDFPPMLYWGAWLIMGLGYTVSGIHKLGSPSWVNGTAIGYLLDNPLARDTFLRELLKQIPIATTLMTYLSLAMEILFLPLIFFKKTRVLIWLGMLFMHIGILMLINFTDLTLGVLMMHLFTFDNRWLNSIQNLIKTKFNFKQNTYFTSKSKN